VVAIVDRLNQELGPILETVKSSNLTNYRQKKDQIRS